VTARPLVLLADDDPDILALVAFRLERSGYDVIRAADGEEALRLVTERRPSLAILDVAMPKLTGYDVTERIRGNDATSAIPVILLTARVQDADVQRGAEVGADDYVKKPLSSTDLRARVQAALARR
jgi:DNA-binding response OmpR family regulator